MVETSLTGAAHHACMCIPARVGARQTPYVRFRLRFSRRRFPRSERRTCIARARYTRARRALCYSSLTVFLCQAARYSAARSCIYERVDGTARDSRFSFCRTLYRAYMWAAAVIVLPKRAISVELSRGKNRDRSALAEIFICVEVAARRKKPTREEGKKNQSSGIRAFI